MSKALKVTLPVLILALGIGAFAYLRASRPEQPAAQIEERIWQVEVMPVQPQRLSPSLTLYGQLETAEMFRAAAPVASRVDKVLVREGERVSAGQLLLSLDERDFLPRLQQDQAEVAELEAKLESEDIRQRSDLESLDHEKRLLALSRQDVDRVRQLQKKKLGSDSALDEARQALVRQSLSITSREQSIADHPARKRALEARLQKARARLDESQLNLERSRVLAPYDGIVAGVAVSEGSRIKANELLLSLYDPNTLELRARIPGPYVSELQQSLSAGRNLEGSLQRGQEVLDLRLVRIAGEARPSGIDALFKIISGEESQLRLGQVLRFDLIRPPQESALAVPFPSVYGGDRIYTLDDGRMKGVAVEILGSYRDAEGQERLLIRSDALQRGDQLVITHLPNAVNGLRAEAVASQ